MWTCSHPYIMAVSKRLRVAFDNDIHDGTKHVFSPTCVVSWISLSNATHSRFESCQYIRTSKRLPAISQRFLWYAHSIWIQISCNTGRSWCIWFVVTVASGATRPRPRLLQIKYITPTRVTTITYSFTPTKVEDVKLDDCKAKSVFAKVDAMSSPET